MGHTVPAATNPALTKRQRRKTYKVEHELPAMQSTDSCVDSVADELEPEICTQQLNTSRSFRDGAAQSSTSNNLQTVAGCPASPLSTKSFSQASVEQAAAATAQSLAARPTLGLATPSTGWLSDSAKIGDRILSLLHTYGAVQTSRDLLGLGYSETVCQRACLEVHLMSKQVDVDTCVQWIKRQPDMVCLNRPVNPLELLKYQDLSKAVSNLLQRVPGINQQTAQIAIQQTLGDEDAAAAFLHAAMSKSHMPSSGDPNTMASLLLQNLPPGFNLPANSGEVVQAMAAAMAKASELQLATDRLAVAAIQSQQQIKAAMASGHMSGVANPDPPQPPAAAPQLGLQTPEARSDVISTVSTGPADSATDKNAMAEKLQLLETHKEWADKKIDQLIKRVKDAERPQKDEAYRLRDEVHKLRHEKDVLESKLKEFERSLQKLKDCTYQEATQKREYERRVQAVQADLRGAHLREQELQHQVEQEAASSRTERKKKENAERICRQAAEEKASVMSTLGEHRQEVSQLQAAARRQDRLAEDRLQRAQEQIASMTQARQELDSKCEILTVEKASMVSGLEAKDAQMEGMQQEYSNVQTQLLLCQERVSQLQCELLQAQQALAIKNQQPSFYSHWNGSSIQFDRNEARSPTSTSPPTPLAVHPQPPASQRSSQDSISSPARQANPQFSPQNFVGFPVDSFASPTQNRSASQADQPASLTQHRIGGRSPGPPQHPKANIQSPIGSHVKHRKSSSMDSSQAPLPSPLHEFGHSKAASGSGSNRGGKPSARSQHAQHALAGPFNNGPIASLLGLSQIEARDSNLGHERLMKPSKSLQYGSTRNEPSMSANDFDPSHLLPRAIHDVTNGVDLGMSWMQQGPSNGRQTNHAKHFGHVGSQDFSQHADAFQRQLRVSNNGHTNM